MFLSVFLLGRVQAFMGRHLLERQAWPCHTQCPGFDPHPLSRRINVRICCLFPYRPSFPRPQTWLPRARGPECTVDGHGGAFPALRDRPLVLKAGLGLSWRPATGCWAQDRRVCVWNGSGGACEGPPRSRRGGVLGSGSPRLMQESDHPAQCPPYSLKYCHVGSDWKLSPAINPVGTLLNCRGFSVLLPWPRFPQGEL